ncbi:hypothetical protein BH11PAT2_BH11PAT2_08280 [soil metagenome]
MHDKGLIEKHLRMAEILLTDKNVKGSFTYMNFGWMIRNKMYSQATALLHNMNFSEIHLSDIIERTEIHKLDRIDEISKNYFSIDGSENLMAAGHEVSFYLYIKSLIKHNALTEFPSKFFHFGSVFRHSRNTKFPFNLGERKSFLECFCVYVDSKDEEVCFNLATQWNRRFINEILHLPSLEVERPLVTNKKFSKKTVCIDTITPLGRTVNTGMTYLHDDIFSKVLGVKIQIHQSRKVHVKCVHFGISDNTFFSYLLNSHDGIGFRLLTVLAPHCVQLILDTNSSELDPEVIDLRSFLRDNGISYEMYTGSEKDIVKVKERSVIKGIPLIITTKKTAGKVILLMDYRGDSETQVIVTENLQSICKSLERNDKDIVDSFQKRQNESVFRCNSVQAINDVVSRGKVAEVYLDQSNENILALESHINSGEILGFKEAAHEGKDLLSGNPIKKLAYISKRI